VKISGGQRLAAFFTLVAVVEVGVMSRAIWLFLDHLEAASVGRSFPSSFWWWTARFVDPMWTLVAFASASVALVALAFRQARGAMAGSPRDPVIKLRDLLRRHPWLGRVLPWIPALFQAPSLVRYILRPAEATNLWATYSRTTGPLALLAVGSLTALAAHFALRSLDLIADRPVDTVTTVDRDETTFLAVAVNARTQGAVLGVFLVTLAMIHGVTQPHFWMRDAAGGLPLVAYAVASLGFAAWFRKASTVAVGRDGIFVRGTSKERFYSYQDFDEVRLAGMHFDFHRAGKRVLRLQLHGTDDARAEALAERIRAALALSHRTDGAHLLARSAVAGSLGRAAQGATDYRQPSVSREQLWELVEGEATDRAARLAAAEALATAIDAQDRSRLRVAATLVADPKVRVALEDLAEDDNRTADAKGPAARTLLRES
jgi:hypothetical protein